MPSCRISNVWFARRGLVLVIGAEPRFLGSTSLVSILGGRAQLADKGFVGHFPPATERFANHLDRQSYAATLRNCPDLQLLLNRKQLNEPQTYQRPMQFHKGRLRG